MAIVDRIKYEPKSGSQIAWKFPGDNIRLGSQLIVNQSQEALLYRDGQVTRVFTPGTYTIDSSNIPFLGKIVNAPFGGETPFSVEVWFVSRNDHRDMKWGTKTPIQLTDPVHDVPLRVGSYGQWGFRVTDSRTFLVSLLGASPSADSAGVNQWFIGEIMQAFTRELCEFIIERKISLLHMATQIEGLADAARKKIALVFKSYGMEITNFTIGAISILEEDLKRIQDVLMRGMEAKQYSNARLNENYEKIRSLNILEKAATSGADGIVSQAMSACIGLLGAANLVQKTFGASPEHKRSYKERLAEAEEMFREKLITEEEYLEKRKDLLREV
ncbi:MAG TPA: SPFH domain-containing protein [Spirochaetota bacterium]|nr:SPFH domain-containing protein [Spirochaetota bacterium]